MDAERYDELVARVRELEYQKAAELTRIYADLQGAYGKWLISTLLVVHGAAIGFIAQSDKLSEALIPGPFLCHGFGLILALLAGLMAWANWSLHMGEQLAISPKLIINDDHWPKPYTGRARTYVRVTFRLSVAFGLLSAALILASILASWSAFG